MNENLMDKLTSNFNNAQYVASIKHESNQVFQDNDSDSSIFNLLDGEFSDKTQQDTPSPCYSMTEGISHDSMGHIMKVAIPDVKSSNTDKMFEDRILSKLPQIVSVEKVSLQYEVLDHNYPCLSKSFKQCFNSPVLDLLVVVLNSEKLVTFFQGYFAGIPRLATELINLDSKYWKSLISNNDENVWENHYKSVTDKFNSRESNELEFEMGPVIRCRLMASHKQQFNFFFVQPCSYMTKLDHFPNRSFQSFNDGDSISDTVYMVSFFNIMRECDTEYALKGSAAASLQKVITNSIYPPNQIKQEMVLENKASNSRAKRILNTGQLSVNISPPAYMNSEKLMLNAPPLTYPLVNEHQYPKSRMQRQQQQLLTQHRHQMPMNNGQYMGRGVSINIINPDQQHYQSPYQSNIQSTSVLQYFLEHQNPNYHNNNKPIHSGPLHMVPQHNQQYQNTGRPNMPCYIPLDHIQSAPSNCSLASPTSFLSTRHLVPMTSNNILLSPDQYFRNSNQVNLIDSVQVAQPMMTVVRSISSTQNHNSNSYYCSTAQSQLSQNHVHVVNSLPHQSQFAASSLPSYCNDKSDMMRMSGQSYNVNQMMNKMPLKQKSYEMTLPQNNWHTNQIMDNSIAASYCEPLNSIPKDCISFDIVEEILKAEEEKSENKQQIQSQSSSDNSDLLSFDLDDFITLDHTSHSLYKKGTTQSLCNPCSTSDTQSVDEIQTKQTLTSSNRLLTLKSETLKKFSNAQKIGIKNLVNQHKDGKITKKQMLQQINDFVSQTLGKDNHQRRVIEFWKTQHPNIDSTLSNINCSHVVQSPEEGPGISPTEQAAQSTTDIEDDKDISRQISKKPKEDQLRDIGRRYNKSKSTTRSLESSIYSITSTTSTGVLETLLNEHDNPVHPERSYTNNNFSTRLSISSIPKNQLSLDQLLMDDDYSSLATYNPSHEDKILRRTSETPLRQLSSSNKSQPSTPNISGNMGVLESLLNQKNPSTYRIRQKSTESILKHSKPSRQNSVDTFQEDNTEEFGDKDYGVKKNSLLITLLNNSNGPSSVDKINAGNGSNSNTSDVSYPINQHKRQRIISESNEPSNESSATIRKQMEKFGNSGMDIFDFVECELNSGNSEFQSGTITSSQSVSSQKIMSGKRNRKRCHSKEMSVDSDGGSDKMGSKVPSHDKKVILTSLLENRKSDDSLAPSIVSEMISSNNDNTNFVPNNKGNVLNYEDNLDLDDIKIDDLDLEHLIDMSEHLDNSNNTEDQQQGNASCDLSSQDPNKYSDNFSLTSYDPHQYSPRYSMVPPVINISQSDPIVPLSKQSVIRVTDKNSILFSAIQSSPSTSVISVECLDNERERLLKQQKQQKVYIGGKYVPLNQLGASDVDSLPTKINHSLSLDLLSKQMKEVGPNVILEGSNEADNFRPRKSSFSKVPPVISPHNPTFPSSNFLPPSPAGRPQSSSSTTTSVDTSIDIAKMSSSTSSQMNHQQVREGLRLLVSNRSAQNISKNTQRSCSTNISESSSSSNTSDFNVTRTSVSKSMIHYHSDTQVPNQPVSSYPLMISRVPTSLSESKATNFLEDSLVNDVFGLEELVNSKTSNVLLANNIYQTTSQPQSISDVPLLANVEDNAMSTDMDFSQVATNVQSNVRLPHHHHHVPHYHHHHPHHHHHTTPVPQPINDSTTTSSKDNKQSNNSSSGLLETLLSR